MPNLLRIRFEVQGIYRGKRFPLLPYLRAQAHKLNNYNYVLI
nr:MAG TPA: hypothetical protein [Microviridae sp.]